MNQPSVKVVDNTFYSIGFPNENWNSLIQRTNYISQIEDKLSLGNRLIFIQGDEDVGKTTLCAQFSRKYSAETISVFFNPLNIIDYEVDYFCTNVVHQINQILHRLSRTESPIEQENDNLISTEQYRQSLFQLRKAIKRHKEKVNIVIDGLELLIKTNSEFMRNLFQIIPFGEDFFRIIITGELNDFISINPKLKREDPSIVAMSGFSEPEIIKYLELSESKSSEITDLYKITKGFPGRLKTLKRLIEKEEYSLEDISTNTTYNSWVELDCDSIDLSVPLYNVLLSLLALRDQSFSINDLCAITSSDLETIEKTLESLPVIDFTGKRATIVSLAHKRYLANILRANRQKIDDLLINFHAQSNSLSSLIELPKLFYGKKEWGKVIELINETYVQKVLEGTGSLKTLNETLDLGVHASEEANRPVDLWRYSLQGSIVNELDNYLFWESEIEARISIRDFTGAISLAESAVVLVDRLRLLALIARREKEFNNKVDEVLISLIQDLYRSIDITSVGDKIYDIVTDLIYALPNLAIEMIEKSSADVSSNNINDWVVAKLSIAAIDSSLKDKDDSLTSKKKLEAVQNLKHPSVRKINRAISFLVGNYSSSKVLEEVKKIPESEEKLKLLRLWLNNHRANVVDIDVVIHSALDELVATSSETSVTVEVLNELSGPLPFVKNSKSRNDLYKRFRAIEDDLSDLGLQSTKYVYRLNMFHTEFTLSQPLAINTINTILKEIDSLNDNLIKLEAYGEVYSKLCFINSGLLRDKINFVYSRIFSLSEKLFETTASHFKVARNFLGTVGRQNPRLTLKLIGYINTQARRERARIFVMDRYLDNNLRHVNIDTLKEIESSLEWQSSREDLYLSVLERYAAAKSLHYKTIFQLIPFGDMVLTFSNLSLKIRGLIDYYKIIVKNEEWKSKLATKVESQIYGCWKKIEADWERIDLGFSICYQVAKINDSFSKKIFLETSNLKDNSWLDSKSIAFTYLNSIKIIIKAYTGLLISKNDTDHDYKILEDLIARVPSKIEKLRLWTEASFNAKHAERDDVVKKIMNDHLIHIMHDLVSSKIDLSDVFESFVMLHTFNQDLALTYINKLAPEYREQIYSETCHYYITKQNPFDIYDKNFSKYNTGFNELSNAVSVMSLVETDVNIYLDLEHVCNAIRDNRDAALAKPQVTTLINGLENIITKKLPDKNNIKHDGFKIVSESKLARVSRAANQSDFWLGLVERTSKIPNKSDMVFVKSILLADIPFDKIPNGGILRKEMFDSIVDDVKSLNAHYEYVQRVIDISEYMYAIDKNKWKQIVSDAFTISSTLKDGGEIYSSQKKIIDSMYRLDAGYAKDLIKQADKDNQEGKVNKLLRKHYETLEMADKIKNSKSLEQKERENHRGVVHSVFLALKSLNSDRVGGKKMSEVIEYLPIGNKLPLHESFPIHVYYLNNCAKTYKAVKDGNMATIHRDNFREAVNATNLIQLLSQRKKINEQSFRKFFIDDEFASHKAIHPKSRESAFSFIKNWLHDEAIDFIIIADPYFAKDDLEILKIIKEVKAELEIDILGSVDGRNSNIENDYKAHWRTLSDEQPPYTNITFCWTDETGDTPFHDRWIITKNSGLRIGTSINSLGKKKESEISVMKPAEALRIREDSLNDYLNRRKKELNSQRVNYKSFSL